MGQNWAFRVNTKSICFLKPTTHRQSSSPESKKNQFGRGICLNPSHLLLIHPLIIRSASLHLIQVTLLYIPISNLQFSLSLIFLLLVDWYFFILVLFEITKLNLWMLKSNYKLLGFCYFVIYFKLCFVLALIYYVYAVCLLSIAIALK